MILGEAISGDGWGLVLLLMGIGLLSVVALGGLLGAALAQRRIAFLHGTVAFAATAYGLRSGPPQLSGETAMSLGFVAAALVGLAIRERPARGNADGGRDRPLPRPSAGT